MEKHQFLLLLGKFEEIRCGIIDVKTAIINANKVCSHCKSPDQAVKEEINPEVKKFTDTELISFLEEENDKCRHTGNCIFRLSGTRRGWRLHETSKPQGCPTVREAITQAVLARDQNLHRGKKEKEEKSEDNSSG